MRKVLDRIIVNWAMWVGLLAGLIFMIFQILGFDLSLLPGDLGDTRFNIYILEHAHQYFFYNTVPTDSYWDAPFFYPQESVISFSDNLLGTFVLYSFFRFLGADLYTAFQFWMIGITILNFVCAYLFFKYLLKNKYAATLGAFIFAFSIALMTQYPHPQTYPRFCIPLAFLFAVKFFENHKVKDLFLVMFFVVYEFYCVVYLGFMLAVPLIILIIITLFLRWKSIVKTLNVKKILSYLGSLVVNLLLLAPLLLPYMNSPIRRIDGDKVIYRTYDEIFSSIPMFESYLFNSGDTLLWELLSNTAKKSEGWWNHQLFIGITCIASIFFLLFYVQKKWIEKEKISKLYYALGTTALLTFLIYIRTNSFSFYEYIFELPGFSAIRALFRIINIELLFFGLFVAIAFKIIFSKLEKQAIVFCFYLAFLVIDNFVYSEGYSSFLKQDAIERVDVLREQLKPLEKGTLFSLEPEIEPERRTYCQIDAMLIAQELGLKTVNGYSSTVPFGYYHFAVNLNEPTRKKWFTKKEYKGDVVVIDQYLNAEIRRIMAKINDSPDWLSRIKQKAEKRNISLKQGIINDAIWVFKENKKKNNGK